MRILKEEAAAAFVFEGKVQDISVFGGGHINDTFLVKTDVASYILQRVNKFVFKKPAEIMENILGVTSFLQKKIAAAGGDAQRETLSLIKTWDAAFFFVDSDGEYWRSMIYIDHSTAYDFATSPHMLYESGFAFGNFQNFLADYPADTLHEVIPNFHNTPARYDQLMDAVASDPQGRVAEVGPEIAFATARKNDAAVLMNYLKEGKLPLKVTHNDTKMSNVLIDDKTGKAICVIDLDTVMPGLTAFDYGDSIRAGATTAAEDEADLTKVSFSIALFEAYTKGFLTAAGKSLTALELETLHLGAKMMTFEVGMRFLADYINGDLYFKTKYPTHNLDRARNQFKLVADMERLNNDMLAIVRKYA